MTFRSLAELEDALAEIEAAPADGGRVELIVRRPRTNEREVLDAARLDERLGLEGDVWGRTAAPTPDDYAVQLTLMNSRVIARIAGDRDRWPLAGDQLFVDLDLSLDNLPAGTRLAIGEAEIEVSAEPHTGCRKFIARFGHDAHKFVNSPEGRRLNLRGINARVVRGGRVCTGDAIRKLPAVHPVEGS